MAKLREGHPELDALYYQIKLIHKKLSEKMVRTGDTYHLYMAIMEKARLQLLSSKANKRLMDDRKSIMIEKSTMFMPVSDPETFIKDCQKVVNKLADTHRITINYEGNCIVENWIILTYIFEHVTDEAHTIQDVLPFDVNEVREHSEKVNAITSL
jgi:hypothetical protein